MLRVADELLAAGASPRARDRTGATPAHAAARLGADAWLDQLAKRDIGLLDERDNRGVSPLDMLETRYRKSRAKVASRSMELACNRLPRPFPARNQGRHSENTPLRYQDGTMRPRRQSSGPPCARVHGATVHGRPTTTSSRDARRRVGVLGGRRRREAERRGRRRHRLRERF